MNFKSLWNKMRDTWDAWMAVLFLLIGVIVNYVNPQYGIALAGMLGFVVGTLVLSALVGGVVMAVDRPANNARQWWKYTVTAFIVLVVATYVTPLAEWIVQQLPFG